MRLPTIGPRARALVAVMTIGAVGTPAAVLLHPSPVVTQVAKTPGPPFREEPTTTTAAVTVPVPVVEVAPAAETPTPPTPVAPPTTRAPRPPARQTLGDQGDGTNRPDRAPRPAPAPAGPIVGKANGPEIEGYARYEGQSTCDPTPKPGTLALRSLLLAHFPNTGSAGISRDCAVGGRSEHKEGRAFDWSANVTNAGQRASVEAFFAELFATDQYGHKHAMARRMGIMYVIWNHSIWSAYEADAGWQPYTGTNPHTDHVHISLSWAGARAETSFWSGTVVPGLPDGLPRASRTGGRNGPWSGPRPTTTTVVRTRDGRRGGQDGGHAWSSTSTTAPSTTSTTLVPATTTTTASPG
jgi:hypothetical protein